jgi:hypothetical protein
VIIQIENEDGKSRDYEVADRPTDEVIYLTPLGPLRPGLRRHPSLAVVAYRWSGRTRRGKLIYVPILIEAGG